MDRLKIEVENLGPIKKCEYEVHDLTIFCGENNSGKTLLSYLTYSVMKGLDYRVLNRVRLGKLNDIVSEILRTRKNRIFSYNEVCELIDLDNYWNDWKQDIASEIFNFEMKNNFKLKISNDIDNLYKEVKNKDEFLAIGMAEDSFLYSIDFGEIKEIKNSELEGFDKTNRITMTIRNRLLEEIFENKVFLLPSTRDGINLLKKGYNLTFCDEKHSEPIKDYIDSLNTIEGNFRKEGEYSKYADLLGEIVGGDYFYSNNLIGFIPKGSSESLSLNIVSSTVRSLAGLYTVLKYEDEKLFFISIDEPELNLHPNNQRKLIQLLCKIVNETKIKVFITTHSPFIMKEINNILIAGEIKDKPKLDNECIMYMDKAKAGAYLVENGTVKKIKYTKREGYNIETFDKLVDSLEETYYKIQDILYEEEENG